MSFTSLIFLLFLPAVLALHSLSRRKGWQNSVLLIANYVFYGWWDVRFCLLIAFSSLVDFYIGHAMHHARRPVQRRQLLWLSLGVNLGLLGVFKYFNFFVDSAVVALAVLGFDINTSTLSILLPVGISFYTFQTLSYTLDIYRGHIAPHRNLLEYLTFVSFFPQLVAGPIERAANLLPQFSRARVFELESAVVGCRLLLWGMFKKMVVADNLALWVDEPYAAPTSFSGTVLAVATVAFAFQIYCDFSGYSDMATGMARMFGIQLQRNFAYPYFARSLSEFWRRWHISLSTWFRDYVFIPLGGSRGSRAVVARNLCLTLFLSGLWHGAAWNFIVWGVYHGLLLTLERAVSTWMRVRQPTASIRGVELGTGGEVEQRLETSERRTNDGLWIGSFKGGLTFFLVIWGWILFRSPSLADAGWIMRQIIIDVWRWDMWWALSESVPGKWSTLVSVIGMVILEGINRHRWNPLPLPAARWLRWLLYTGLFWWILYFGTEQSSEFIYFQF